MYETTNLEQLLPAVKGKTLYFTEMDIEGIKIFEKLVQLSLVKLSERNYS